MSELKETKELVAGAVALAMAVIKELKDGLQVGKDAVALVDDLMKDKDKIVAAVEGISKVLPELKESSLVEKLDLVVEVAKQVIDILNVPAPVAVEAPAPAPAPEV